MLKCVEEFNIYFKIIDIDVGIFVPNPLIVVLRHPFLASNFSFNFIYSLFSLTRCLSIRLKGQCHEIFLLLVFFIFSFPPAPEYPLRTVSNFFENSRRYSQVKVNHRWQRHRRQNCRRYQRHRRQICHREDTGGKFCHKFC